MNARLDHRRILDNLDAGWPAETITWAQAEYDAELRRFRPDDPGVAPQAEPAATSVAARPVLRAPARVPHDPGPARLAALVFASAGITLGAIVVVALAWAWGL